jgi:hypothetical protein
LTGEITKTLSGARNRSRRLKDCPHLNPLPEGEETSSFSLGEKVRMRVFYSPPSRFS